MLFLFCHSCANCLSEHHLVPCGVATGRPEAKDPSVQILIPSEESGQQNLVCSGRGLNPQVKWLLESKPVSSLPNDVSVDKNGRVAATSQLHVPQKNLIPRGQQKGSMAPCPTNCLGESLCLTPLYPLTMLCQSSF
uniref:Ig-like domain-containing protein n=1 Tax=Kryptolebias marmoratus TaxID=37003 RepID=A0A3Q3ACH6_KRYMA